MQVCGTFDHHARMSPHVAPTAVICGSFKRQGLCTSHCLGGGPCADISSSASTGVVGVRYFFRASKTVVCYLRQKTRATSLYARVATESALLHVRDWLMFQPTDLHADRHAESHTEIPSQQRTTGPCRHTLVVQLAFHERWRSLRK